METQAKKPTRRRRLRVWQIVLLVLLCIVIVGGIALAIYFQPYPASADAQAAMQNSAGVTVSQDNNDVMFMPHTKPSEGLIFYPGAKVPPEAYAVYMHALAEHGYAVFVMKLPLNFAIFDPNAADRIITAYPAIHVWAIGGHSLGGVEASAYAASHPKISGLLLYASYPGDDKLRSSKISVVSISGSKDALATPQKVDDAKPLLPADTHYVVIQGGIHGFFGDYGVQPGDGQPSITRAQARPQIIDASLQLLQEVATNAA